ncbi:peptidoglycan metallopeptidase Pgp3 [Sulfurimonas sp.]
MKFFFLLTLFISSLFAFNIEMKSDEVANGKTLFLEFPQEKGITYLDLVFEKKKFKIFKNPSNKKKYYCLVPVSYYDTAGSKKLKVEYLNVAKRLEKDFFIKVVNAKYKQEKIKVSSKKVNPRAPKVKKRISQEYKIAMKIYNNVTNANYMKQKFILPLESNITSAFGTARVYNGSLKGYHSGTDFRAKMGTPIKVANDGKVALVKKRFYSGGTVLIDHGEGIYSCYFHMSKFYVKKGDFVKRGQVLGLSGKSGRVTGPHLHFSARISGVQVDPLQLISLLNNNLLKGK